LGCGAPLKTIAKSKWFTIAETEVQQEIILCGNEVLVIAQDDDGRILLTEEPSYAFGGTRYYLPGGEVEKGEQVTAAGVRELREETGFGATNAKVLGKLHPWIKYLQMTSHVIFATGLKSDPLKGDEEYAITTHRKTKAELQALIASGEIADARVVAALSLWLSGTWA